MRLGNVLRDWRTMNRLEQKDVARIIGVAPSTISNLEAGKGVNAETLVKVTTWLWGEVQPAEQAAPQLALTAPAASPHLRGDEMSQDLIDATTIRTPPERAANG